jgi:AcrR family transcriptional regulator
MILKTFENLSTERREEIIMAAFGEFALKGYQSASLSEIIKKLDLAKGSFYRYFDSKKSLYEFLLQTASARRLAGLRNLIEQPDMDFFELIKQNFLEKIRFDIENPVIAGFLYRVMHERENNEVSEIVKLFFNGIIEQTKEIVLLHKFRTQLSDIDPVLMAFHIFNMQLWLYDYVIYKFKVDFDRNIKEMQPILTIPYSELEELIDNSVRMLKNGIS